MIDRRDLVAGTAAVAVAGTINSARAQGAGAPQPAPAQPVTPPSVPGSSAPQAFDP